MRDITFDPVTGRGEYGWSGGQVSTQGDALISWHHYLKVDRYNATSSILKHYEDASGFYIPFIS
jgi:hypothetical protein